MARRTSDERSSPVKSIEAGNDDELAILRILNSRSPEKTICPSEVLAGIDKTNPEMMESVREAVRKLVADGKIEILQRGKAIDVSNLRGPIRLKLKR